MSNSSVIAGLKSESLVQLEELYSFNNDPVPKARKPYTITKQREKWTEEEHQRFLEALKLYGRGWRQIEEHVGSKTAVQIRSHAQKFFSKVVRESNGSSENSIVRIEIPPPRPKRKPVHPYPRKSVVSLKVKTVSNQQEGFLSSNVMVLDKDRQSPTSVLSAFASDTLVSAASDQQNRCSSPNSCTTELHSVNLLPVEKENEYVTSNASPKEERVSTISTGSNVEELVSVKIEPQSKETVCIEGDAATAPPCISIKLFGRTVLVTGSLKPYSPAAESYKSPISKSNQENLDFDKGTVFPCIDLPKEKTNVEEESPNTYLPWCSLYQGVPFFNLMSNNQSSVSTTKAFCGEEGSCTGSSIGSVGELENKEKRSDVAVDSRRCCPSSQASPSRCTKGFVPYKRCLAESGRKSSLIVSEERERQRARVCS